MNHLSKLKRYKTFLESKSQYSIYDFCNDLKENRHSGHLSDVLMRKWVNHFIGDGWFDKIDKYIDKMWVSMKKVDVDTVNDRLFDLWDEIPNKDKWVTTSIAYGSYTNKDKLNKSKYNGLMPVSDLTKPSTRNFIMNEIVFNIVWETIRVGGWKGEVHIRNTDEEIYVTDDKYNCENFKLDNFSGFIEYDGGDIKWLVGNEEKIIRSYYIDKYKNYSPSNILNMYAPCLLIDIGRNDDPGSGKVNLKELESNLDDILPSILPTLDYNEVIWGMDRGSREYDDNIDIYDYTLKILLNF